MGGSRGGWAHTGSRKGANGLSLTDEGKRCGSNSRVNVSSVRSQIGPGVLGSAVPMETGPV